MNKKELKIILRKTIKSIDLYDDDADILLYMFINNEKQVCDIHNLTAYKKNYSQVKKLKKNIQVI